MSQAEKNVKVEDREFSLCAVPDDQRKSCFSLIIVWTGFVFIITSMMAGGGLAKGLPFNQIIIATLLGNVFLSIIAVLVAYISSKTGLTFALMTSFSFGSKGSRIASLFVPIVNIGWYTIQAATYGHFIASIFKLNMLGESICMMVSAILMGIFALKGIKAITILGYVAIPAIIFLSLGTSIRGVQSVGLEYVLSYVPESSNKIALGAGITAVIGTWILSAATCLADIMRYAKSTKEAIIATLTGLLGGNIFMIMCGVITTISTGESDLTTVLLTMGLIIPSVLLMTTNIFTTNAANLYSTSLNLSNAFKMDRTKLISIILGISALATLTRPYKIDSLFFFLNILGKIVPPLSGIILADYFIIHKGKYPLLKSTKFKSWNVIPWISWGLSLVVVFTVKVGLPSLNGMVSGILIYSVLMKLTKTKIIEEKEN